MESKLENKSNASIKAIITADLIEKQVEKIAKELSKTMNVPGFRKGKVPSTFIKTKYKDKLKQDAEQEALKDLYENGLKELNVDVTTIIGEPRILTFNKKENGEIEVEIKIDIRPEIEVDGYRDIVPEITLSSVSEDEIKNRLDGLLKSSASLKKLTDRDIVENGDFVLIDFEGFIDGKAFEGGKAEAYSLEIGSGSFIPGFENGVIGMKIDEQKEINVTFPQSYGSKELAGKKAIFKVKLLEIQIKDIPTHVDDETAKKLLPGIDGANADMVQDKIKEQLSNEKKYAYYMSEVKPKYIEALISKYQFDLPEGIVAKEVDFALRNRLSSLSPEQLEELRESREKIEQKREELKEDASNSVKLTFIVDQIARAEKIEVDDNEVHKTIMYEAYKLKQDPKKYLDEYQKQGLLPAVKMSLIEDKLFVKLFDEKLKG